MSGFASRAAFDIRSGMPEASTRPVMRQLAVDTTRMRHRIAEDAEQRATAARADAIAHLEELHATLRARFAERGIGYHLAATPEEAVSIIRGLLGNAKRVAKSKTMVGEEIGLTHALREAGMEVLETDIGEYIVDIEGRGPSHLTAPAIHLNRSQIRTILEEHGEDLPDDDPTRLSLVVRDAVAAFFQDCDAGITGANQVSAASGRIAIVENEGNVSLGASHPRLHISVTGYEKVVRDDAGALAVLEVLASNATAQPLTSFTHFLADPMPGQERHVVFVDNNRSAIAASERYHEALQCIRCGACMNNCPVYRAAGGIAYASPYMGPIGAVVSPLLWPDGRYADLPFASTLCGACTDACPVGIPLHRMLLDLRADSVRDGTTSSRAERAAWRAWRTLFTRPAAARFSTHAARLALKAGHRTVRRPLDGTRTLPAASPVRRPDALIPLDGIEPLAPYVSAIPHDSEGKDLVTLYRTRADAVGVTVADHCDPRPGDVVVEADAGIAETGSVLLTGANAALRTLLGGRRLVIHLHANTLVRWPRGLVTSLGSRNALILTGASRTADIEKNLVRGIHGAEEMLVVLHTTPEHQAENGQVPA